MTDFQSIAHAARRPVMRALLKRAVEGPLTAAFPIPDALVIRLHAAGLRLRKKPLSQKACMAAVRALGGMTCVCHDGEYRVNYARANEATAYYTSNAEDALGTAIIMRYGSSVVIDALSVPTTHVPV
jgi:hypothetical protein